MNPEESISEKTTKDGIISRLSIATEVDIRKIKRRRISSTLSRNKNKE